jgi:hypothetical protein
MPFKGSEPSGREAGQDIRVDPGPLYRVHKDGREEIKDKFMLPSGG